MKLQKLFFAAVIILSANAAIAQDTTEDSHLVTINIPEVALLDLEGPAGVTAITLAGEAPTEAGEAMTFGAAATNATIWMNYSSIVRSSTDSERSVTVALAGAVPTGLKLTVIASPATLSLAGGTLGAAALTNISLISDATAATPIVTAIGSAYTGDGINQGHKLTYQLGYAGTATDYADLDFDNSAELTITYTLSDI